MPVRMVIIKTTVAEGEWGKRNPATLLVGISGVTGIMENTMEVPQKTKNRITLQSSNPTTGHISGGNYKSKRYMHPYIHSKTIHNNRNMEKT